MSTNKIPYDIELKLLLIGDSGVGKTCMLLRFSDDTFKASTVATVGIDYKIKYIQLDGQTVKLQAWDTAGQERFQNLTSAYYRGAHGIFLVYDVTCDASFRHVQKWMKNIEKLADSNVSVVIVGNKCDSPDRVISTDRGEELSEKFNKRFIETSAKQNINISKAFTLLAKEAKRSKSPSNNDNNNVKEPTIKIKEEPSPSPPKEGCCN